jgi:hypothetical protein
VLELLGVMCPGRRRYEGSAAVATTLSDRESVIGMSASYRLFARRAGGYLQPHCGGPGPLCCLLTVS